MPTSPLKICKIQGCRNPQDYFGLCLIHKDWRGHNKKGRIATDPNEFIMEGDICRIILYDKNGNENGETIIDIEDAEKCSHYKWHLHHNRVFCSSLACKTLPNFLMDFISSPKMVIDHRDGNPLNNRKNNLRICDQSKNIKNQKIRKDNTSGHKGVSWDSRNNKWAVGIYYNNRHYWLGYFTSKEEAALAYNEKAKELFGEFAVLNKVDGQ